MDQPRSLAKLPIKRRLRFLLALLAASGAYLVAIALLAQFVADHPGDSRMPWIAALPVVAMFVLLALGMSSLRGMDERERKMHFEALAFAFLGSLVLSATLSFFAFAGVYEPPMPLVTPVMVLLWVIGLAVSLWKHR